MSASPRPKNPRPRRWISLLFLIGKHGALDEKSGKLLWQTKIVPTKLGYSGGSIWDSTPVIDVARNSVYVGTGNNFSVPSYVKTHDARARR
jgi:hypothetical protein